MLRGWEIDMGRGREVTDEVLSMVAWEEVRSIGSVGIDVGGTAVDGCATGLGLRDCG